jgi:hypothetical protein
MNISIQTIRHDEQRYETCGDWYFSKGRNGVPGDGDMDTGWLRINVSAMKDWRYELLVAVHELVEVAIAKNNGITVEEVDAFDMAFESKRKSGNTDEPGDDSKCPIKREHCIATGVERILAAELGVDWKKYESSINAL